MPDEWGVVIWLEGGKYDVWELDCAWLAPLVPENMALWKTMLSAMEMVKVLVRIAPGLVM